MINIRSASINDLHSVVEVHGEAFPNFFLTRMGSGFLREMYSGYLCHSSGIFLVATDRDDIVGFVVGTTSPEKFFSDLRKKRALFFLVYSIPGLLRNPILVFKKLFSAIFYRGDKPEELIESALLSSIGVKPDYFRKSVGRSLLEGFEGEAFSKGSASVFLTTDKLNNDRVNLFYRNNGYAVESFFTQVGGRQMLRYIKKR